MRSLALVLALLSSASALHTKKDGKHAYAIFIDTYEGHTHYLLDMLATLQSIRKYSQEKILVFTNTEKFATGEDVKTSLANFGNLEVQPIPQVEVPQQWKEFNFMAGCGTACAKLFSKLKIWKMTEYDAITMMDVDGILTKNMDHLFEKSGTWAQRANFKCKGDGSHGASQACGGFLMVHPADAVYNVMSNYMKMIADAGYIPAQAEQTIINNVFKNDKNDALVLMDNSSSMDTKLHIAKLETEKVFEGTIPEMHQLNMMSYEDANFGHCQPEGSVPSGWVHKMKDCFGVNKRGARCRKAAATTVHLGQLWSQLFCEGVKVAQISESDERIKKHCSDEAVAKAERVARNRF